MALEAASSDATAYYNHIIGHPLLDASFVDDLLSTPSTTMTNHDADWYDPSHTVVRYELEDAGDVFFDLHTDEVYFDGVEDLRTQFDYHIPSALEQAIDEILVDVNNLYEDVFDETVLYPAFAQQEALVPFWNAVAPSLFDVDFASDPAPELRDRTEELGMQPLQAFLGWLIIGSCVEHEIPAFGQTSQALEQILGDTPIVNWANTTAGLGELGPPIEHAIYNQLYEYTQETLPEHDELLRIHANREHMELAVETIAYRPVYSMRPSDDWSENQDVSDYFWAEGSWHLEIKAARPHPHEEDKGSLVTSTRRLCTNTWMSAKETEHSSRWRPISVMQNQLRRKRSMKQWYRSSAHLHQMMRTRTKIRQYFPCYSSVSSSSLFSSSSPPLTISSRSSSAFSTSFCAS